MIQTLDGVRFQRSTGREAGLRVGIKNTRNGHRMFIKAIFIWQYRWIRIPGHCFREQTGTILSGFVPLDDSAAVTGHAGNDTGEAAFGAITLIAGGELFYQAGWTYQFYIFATLPLVLCKN